MKLNKSFSSIRIKIVDETLSVDGVLASKKRLGL